MFINLYTRLFKQFGRNELVFGQQHGAELKVKFISVDHDLFTTAEDLTAENYFPDGAMVFGMGGIVTEAVVTTGAPTHLRVGDGTVNYLDFVVGAGNAVALGTRVNGNTDPAGASPVTLPKLYTAATNLVIAKVAGTSPAVTAGKIRLIAWYFDLTAPTA